MSTPDGPYTAHAILLQCSADLPSLTNMKNFSGWCGCLYCTNPGKIEASAPLHRFWPKDPSATLRTKESYIHDGKSALLSGDAVCDIQILHTCVSDIGTCVLQVNGIQLSVFMLPLIFWCPWSSMTYIVFTWELT